MSDKPIAARDAKAAAKAAREARLAKALRDNLRRRKASATGEKTPAVAGEKPGSAPAGPTKPDKP
jgi:hypothetical protein